MWKAVVTLYSGWLERDGSLRWWEKFRSADIRPYKDWPGFRKAALERLAATRHVVLKEHRHGVFVFFAQSDRAARSPWIFFSVQDLEVPFEDSSDSPARKKFVLWCIQQLGPCEIILNG